MTGEADPSCLLADHDGLLLDLDGVVWTGGQAVAGAAETLRRVRDVGTPVAFVTNNASRTPQDVVDRLLGVGMAASAEEVHTASQAAARLVAERCGAGATVLAVGGQGVPAALAEAGLVPTDDATDEVAAVVQGFGQDVCWRDLATATRAVRAGAWWVATNTDPTLPTEDGPAPGNGTLVAAVRTAAGTDPVVAGKPEAPLLRLAVDGCGASRPLLVGDRLDTDVAGARAAGVTAALVLTGVSGPADLLAAPPQHRPDLLLADLSGLLAPPRRAGRDGSGWRCGEARADTGGGHLQAGGPTGPDGLDRLRAACAAVWAARDDGVDVDAGPVTALLDREASPQRGTVPDNDNDEHDNDDDEDAGARPDAGADAEEGPA